MRTIALSMTVALLVAVGCEGTTVTNQGGDKKLTLMPPSNQTLYQGGTDPIKISIRRDKFTDAVTVTFDQLPSGVDVAENNLKIPSDGSAANFTLRAAADAKLVENHPARVTVTGPDGMTASENFKLSVRGRK